MIPEWLPNLHPLIIHFPVALLVVALAADILRLFLRKHEWLSHSALLLYLTGTLGLVAAYLSGKEAIKTVSLTGDAVTAAARHEDFGLYTLIFFLVFTTVKFIVFWKGWETKQGGLPGMILLSIGGVFLLGSTADLGGKLVFKHGVAVQEVDRLREELRSLELQMSNLIEEARPVIDEETSWIWQIAPGAELIIHESFTVIGDDSFNATVQRDTKGNFLVIEPVERHTFLLFGETMKRVEGEMELNVDHFVGQIELIHHFQDQYNYQYLRLENGIMSQGQRRDNSDNLLMSEKVSPNGWITIKVLASGRHFYGYKNGRTITHTHADEMMPGRTGISFQGKGQLKLRLINYDGRS